MAAPAIKGLSSPAAAIGMAATLYPNAQIMFIRIVRMVARARSSACGTVFRSSRTRMMSAAPSATSVPRPIANPKSAPTNAGPSF